MKILKTKFRDLLIIKNHKYLDNRGEFREILVEKNLKTLDILLSNRKKINTKIKINEKIKF